MHTFTKNMDIWLYFSYSFWLLPKSLKPSFIWITLYIFCLSVGFLIFLFKYIMWSSFKRFHHVASNINNFHTFGLLVILQKTCNCFCVKYLWFSYLLIRFFLTTEHLLSITFCPLVHSWFLNFFSTFYRLFTIYFASNFKQLSYL